MAARPCSPNDSMVLLDVDGGEYLRYEVSFQGATANFTVEDTTANDTVIDESGGPTTGPFTTEWPGDGQSVDYGRHIHVFSGIFLAASSYSLRVVHCRSTGATKKVLKNCTWTVGGPRPITALDVRVLTAEDLA